MPAGLCSHEVAAARSGVLIQYPQLGLEFSVHDRFVDLVGDGIDVAIRIGEVADSGLHAKRIGTARRICVAAPRYLEAHGTPDSPAALRVHNCVLYTLLATGATWPFEGMPVQVLAGSVATRPRW